MKGGGGAGGRRGEVSEVNRSAPYLPDLLPELDLVDEKERVFLSQQRRGKSHRIEQDITSSNVEQPRYLL